MTSPLVDFHCHLDLYPDFERALAEAEDAGIYTLAVTTTPRAWERNYNLTRNHKYVRPALGLHPQTVGSNLASELQLWEQLLPEARYVGEVGLDAGPDFVGTLPEQKKAFKRILTLCSEAGNKVLSVHALRSVDTVLDMIEALLPNNRGIVVMHWFTGTPQQAQRAVKLGCYFSVNAPMLHGERGQSLLRIIPIDRVLTETDGPFAKKNDQPYHPQDVTYAVQQLGKVLGMSEKQTRSQVAGNLKSLLAD